ncbi:MAG: HAMP domain-containing sensor histidine kinase [Thermoleophilia bacterium]
MISEVLMIAAATAVSGLCAAALVVRGRTLRRQLLGVAVLGVIVPLLAVLGSGLLMLSHRDLQVLGIACLAGLVSVGGALLLGRRVGAQIAALRAAPAAVAAGDLSARAPRGGPAELDALAASFNEMAAHLEELFDARRRLVAWAGHDLRTPLASLRAMIEAVEDGLAEPGEYLPHMRAQVAALTTLVDDLFELARLDAGDTGLVTRRAPPAALVEGALARMRADAQARGVHLHAHLDEALPAVRCAPDKVGRVLDNLLVNALRHTPRGGEVRLAVAPLDREVCVAVEDTGDGLSDEALTSMFDHFWRGDPARTRDGGAGLGLAIARGLVEAHGGRIWAERREPRGARVAFTLPVADAEA